jgi:indoleacetamide hydrolase
VFPTTMTPAPLIGEDEIVAIRGKKVSFFTIAGRNIAPGSTTGLPGLVLPAGLSRHGLPVGIEFDAPAGSDRALLALGLNLERALGGIAAPSV